MKYLLFNSLSNNETGAAKALEIKAKLGECEMMDVTKITDIRKVIGAMNEKDEVCLVGGDGTLNRFVNDLDGVDVKPAVYLYPAGTGNDFFNDVKKEGDECVKINEYIKGLPTVYVNDIVKKFINGIGYGIDGMCCQVADDQKAKGKKKINYSSIAVNLLLFTYTSKSAKVTVDGVEKTYENVWILPTMKGRYYGGGMKVAPDQDRSDKDGKVSVVVFKGKSRLKVLMNFSKIFTGEHVKLVDMIEIRTGKEVTVEYNEPTALQIDGETVRNVRSYTVKA